MKDKKLRNVVEKLCHKFGVSFDQNCYTGDLDFDEYTTIYGGDSKKLPVRKSDLDELTEDINDKNANIATDIDSIREDFELLLGYLGLEITKADGKFISKVKKGKKK